MKNITLITIMMLLIPTVFLSCSFDMMETDDNHAESNARSIIITGAVTDAETGNILEDITINYAAYLKDHPDSAPLTVDEIHSNSKGTFTIMSEGADQQLLCILIANDPKGIYDSQTKQIIVSWEGTSFDKHSNMFIINDCIFKLRRKN